MSPFSISVIGNAFSYTFSTNTLKCEPTAKTRAHCKYFVYKRPHVYPRYAFAISPTTLESVCNVECWQRSKWTHGAHRKVVIIDESALVWTMLIKNHYEFVEIFAKKLVHSLALSIKNAQQMFNILSKSFYGFVGSQNRPKSRELDFRHVKPQMW